MVAMGEDAQRSGPGSAEPGFDGRLAWHDSPWRTVNRHGLAEVPSKADGAGEFPMLTASRPAQYVASF